MLKPIFLLLSLIDKISQFRKCVSVCKSIILRKTIHVYVHSDIVSGFAETKTFFQSQTIYVESTV